MTKQHFNLELLDYLDQSPTPFHAVSVAKKYLEAAGFDELKEHEIWKLKTKKSYFVIRNNSSIIAFRLGSKSPVENGFRMVGAHTDSPCLKVKPEPEIEAQGYNQLGVEVYGGVLLNPWFDRDLSLAGRVTIKNSKGLIENKLVDFESAIATLPSLAIHLDKEANNNRKINKQTYLPPVVSLMSDQTFDLKSELGKQLSKSDKSLKKAEILDFELSFYDTQKAALIGLNEEFIASARLDNLLSCYTGLKAIIENAKTDVNQLLVCNDHEEVGSGSASGARGNFLSSILKRIVKSEEDYARMMASSMFISTDNAHGIHPNFADKHDSNHGSIMNAGPVIKINSNQAYASNSETAGIFRHVADLAKVPTQSFVSRGDMGCGSTIGPLTATVLGVKAVDVGVPTFAMHSIRELAGSDDAYSLYQILRSFFATSNIKVQPT
ncbi:MAG: M18 family aminopeptidase [Gammaproteobacteria bacterium]